MAAGRAAEKLQNRPAHAVLVDFQSPMDGEVVSVIQEALSQALTLVYHLKGVCRISYFSLTALGAFPEALFPIQLVRSNLNQLISAINELQSFTGLAARRTMPTHHTNTGHVGGVLVEGLQQVVDQFQRMALNFRQGTDNSFPSQLEVTVLTCQSPSLVQAAMEGAGERMNVDHLTRIQVVCINRKQMALDHVMTEEEDHYPLDMNTSDPCSSILDVCSVECEAVALSAMFKGWLHASTTDQEDVHIELPPSTGSGELTVLKCDLSECMLDPALLPMFESHFSIHSNATPFTGSTTNSFKPTTSQQKAAHTLASDSVRHFKALSLVDREGVCESVLFGLPMVLKPTSCWKLDWEDLESNTHNFAAVCKLLKERDQMLVVSELRNSAVPLRPSKSAPSQQPPLGHFLILPSHSPSSLLIKPIIVSELYLPSAPSENTEEPSCETMVNVEGSLEKLPTQSLYNPLEVCSGLYSSLQMLQSNKKGGGGGRTTNSSAGTKRKPSMPAQQSEAQRTAAISRTLGPKKSRLTVTSGGVGSHGNTSCASRGSGRANPLRYQPPPPYLEDDFEM